MSDDPRRARVAMVDDNSAIRDLVGEILDPEGVGVSEFGSGAEFLSTLAEEDFDCVLLDIRLPRESGLDILAKIKERRPEMPVVMITGDASVPTIVDAMGKGAFDYLTKPIDVPRLIRVVEHARVRRVREREIAQLRETLQDRAFRGLLGSSPAFAKTLGTAKRVAGSMVSVLLMGESGTGKGVLARAIHEASSRGAGPFLAINCAAVPEALLEAELFGHVKGAFTGADRSREGRFEASAGGTIFLDEIGEMPLSLQPKLLRVLEEKTICRVGSNAEVNVDVRILAATNGDIEKAVAEGRFRTDLFFRLNTVTISIPPLRERPEDILPLADWFLARAREEEGCGPHRLADAVRPILSACPWPGNIRELKHCIEHAVVLGDGEEVLPEDLPNALREPRATITPSFGALPTAIQDLEIRMIREALDVEQGVKARAARRLGLTERILSYKMRTLGLE